MFDLNIIQLVREPSSWISSLIAEYLRAFLVDKHKTNTAIKRNHYPGATPEELLEKPNGCIVFSNIDLKHGCHQIELDKTSRYITPFIIHISLFRYKRLVGEATSTIEKYQNCIKNELFKHLHKVSRICQIIF